MSTESEPDTALDHPAARTRQKSMSVSEWFERHGLIPALVPMAYRENDPIEQLTRLSAEIDSLPDTAATFTVNTILDDDERFTRTFAASAHITTLFRLCGAFRVDDTSTGYRWCNPDYVHGSVHRTPQGTREEVAWFCKRAARLGVLQTRDVARKYGRTERSIQTLCQDYDLNWRQRRHEGMARFARTVETVHEWTGRTYAEICAPTLATYQMFQAWRDRHVAGDWSPPADPTTASGFSGR
jgi:hypothetical protein